MKRLGKAEILYASKTNQKRVRIYVYILGTSDEVPKGRSEVITMEMGYSVLGQEIRAPETVHLNLVSYSPEVPKYADHHDLTILADGKVLVRNTAVDLYADDSEPTSVSESYGFPKMSFSILEGMARAKGVSIQLGQTKIDLTDEALRAIQDLLKTTQN
ncbi:MAG TPA: hypothetical protein VJV05_15175 [Pyrinomonadaceae bacterium]|nr:hypothetical protein [Pyrinomonadaceae bacterium]